MPVTTPGLTIENLTLSVTQEIHVRSSLTATFAALLEQMGPSNETPESQAMPMKIEPWPGGRWFRDLGDGNGHFWGVVQAIKRPTLLEISGPLFMSYPVISNVQYRLTDVDGGTLITLRHTALRIHSRTTTAQACRAGGRRFSSADAQARGSLITGTHARWIMAMIDAFLQELEQEAQTTRRVLERVPEDQLGWRPHPQVDVARAASAACRDRARQRRRAVDAVAVPGAEFTQRAGNSTRSCCPPSTRASPRPDRCSAAWTMRRSARRGGWSTASRRSDGDPARGAAADGHAEPLVSPPRPAVRVSPRARCAGSVDLRTERRRKPVRDGASDERCSLS